MICFGSLFSEEEQPRALGIASSAMFGGGRFRRPFSEA